MAPSTTCHTHSMRREALNVQSVQQRADSPKEAFISDPVCGRFPSGHCAKQPAVCLDDWFLALVNNSFRIKCKRCTSHYALSPKQTAWMRNNPEMRCQTWKGWHHGATLLGTGSSLAYSYALDRLPSSHCQRRSV